MATIIGTSAYTAASVQAQYRSAAATAPARAPWASPWPAVLGIAALPLALGVVFAAQVIGLLAVVLALAVWVILVGLAYGGAGSTDPWKRAAAIVAVGTAAFALEFVLGATLVLGSGSGLSLYLIGALAVGIGAAVFFVNRLAKR